MSKTSLKEIRISQNNAVVGTNATGDVEEKLISTLKNDLELEADDVDDSTSTNKFVQQADKDKLSNITVTSPINLDSLGSSVTNLSYNDGTIESDTGTDAVIPDSTSSVKGLATPSQITKLDGIESGAEVNRTGAETVSLINTELGSTIWQLGGGGGGSSNPNEFIPTTAADLSNVANAGQIACIQTNITLTANLTLAEGLILKNCGGVLNIGTFTLTGQNNTIYFDGDETVINAFSGTIDGTWNQPKLMATTLGAIDDDNIATDNFNVGKNLLHLINQSSGHLYWNKKDTGKYYIDCNDDVFGSPFFGNIPNRDLIWLVGDGYDNVTVEHAGNVELKVIPGFTDEQAIYVTYDCHSPRITGGTLRGDRYLHQYDQELEVNSPATQAGNVQLRIVEHPKRADNLTENEIIVQIPLSLSDLTTNRGEVRDFINNNTVELADYTATFPGVNGDSGNPDKINVSGAPGVFYTFFFTDVDSGATVSQDVSPYEWGHGVVIGSNTRFAKVDNIQITEFFGDAIARQVQENGQTGIDFADLTQGYIEDNGVIDGANTDFYYLTTPRNVPTQHPWVQFRQGTSSTIDLAYYRYRIAFYDASDVFIKASKWLEPNEIYYIEPEWVKYRIIVDNNGSDITNFDYFFQSPSNAYKCIIEDCELSFNRRHAITNPPNGSVMRNNLIHDNGGVEPESGINIEDFGKRSIGYQIYGNEFWNQTAIDIILKGPSKVKIFNNKFLSNTTGIKNNPNDKDIAISAAYSRVVDIYNNDFHNKSLSIDIQHKFQNNNTYECEVNVRAGGAVVSGNVFLNTKLRDGSVGNIITSASGGANAASPSYIENNKFFLNRGWETTPLIDEENTLVWRNNIFEFNHTVSQHSVLVDPVRLIELNNSSTNFLKADNTVPEAYYTTGSYKGLEIKNVKASPGSLHSVGWPLYAANVFDLQSSTSIEVDGGYPKDFTMERMDITGWLEFILTQYPTDGVGTFNTITVRNAIITVPEQIDANEGYLNNTQFGGTQRQKLIRTPLDANVNFIFENVKFISKDVTNTQFAFFGHRGTTTLRDCTFSAPTAEVIDLSLSGTDGRAASVYTGANTGAITIINPTYENISFALRGGDVESFYGGNATDVDAIHDNIAGEINAITAKATPVAADIIIIEDSEDSFNKKKADLSTLLGGGSSFTLANGQGTTANGSAVDLGGTVNSEVNINIVGTGLESESVTIGGTDSTGNIISSLFIDPTNISTLVEDSSAGSGTTLNQVPSNISIQNNSTNSSDLIQVGTGLITLQSDNTVNADVQSITISNTEILFPNLTNAQIDAASNQHAITKGWFNANNGLDTTQDLTLDDGTNTTPTFNLENSSDSRLRFYALNSIAYIESEAISNDVARALRVKASNLSPTTNDAQDFGQTSQRWRDGWFSRNVTAEEFRVNGGLDTQFLKANGSLDNTTYLQSPSVSLVNVNRDFALTDNRTIIRSTGASPTLTVRLESAVNFPIGSQITIINDSAANTITIAAEAGVSIVEDVGGLTMPNEGSKRTLTKTASDRWVLGY